MNSYARLPLGSLIYLLDSGCDYTPDLPHGSGVFFWKASVMDQVLLSKTQAMIELFLNSSASPQREILAKLFVRYWALSKGFQLPVRDDGVLWCVRSE